MFSEQARADALNQLEKMAQQRPGSLRQDLQELLAEHKVLQPALKAIELCNQVILNELGSSAQLEEKGTQSRPNESAETVARALSNLQEMATAKPGDKTG